MSYSSRNPLRRAFGEKIKAEHVLLTGSSGSGFCRCGNTRRISPAQHFAHLHSVAASGDHAPTNIALDLSRELYDGDTYSHTSEMLYALHRLWSEYQSPNSGTSPIDAFDAGDECAAYDYIAPELDELDPDEAMRQIQHATRVYLRWNDLHTSGALS